MLHYILEMKKTYRTNHLFIPIGGDFFFGNAKMTFGSLDNLIRYFNSHVDGISLMYSTPSEYFDAVQSIPDMVWPTRYDDMFPYAD